MFYECHKFYECHMFYERLLVAKTSVMSHVTHVSYKAVMAHICSTNVDLFGDESCNSSV